MPLAVKSNINFTAKAARFVRAAESFTRAGGGCPCVRMQRHVLGLPAARPERTAPGPAPALIETKAKAISPGGGHSARLAAADGCPPAPGGRRAPGAAAAGPGRARSRLGMLARLCAQTTFPQRALQRIPDGLPRENRKTQSWILVAENRDLKEKKKLNSVSTNPINPRRESQREEKGGRTKS